jgi:hypothetical protein
MPERQRRRPGNATEENAAPDAANAVGPETSNAMMNELVNSQEEEPPARLHIFADIDKEDLGYEDLKNGDVGHTWVSLEWKDPKAVPADVHSAHKSNLEQGGQYADPMGFWPNIFGDDPEYYSTDVFKSYVGGHMLHPDREHEGAEKASQSYDLTKKEADNVIKYAESKRGAKYSVYFYNCTTFGVEAVKAAGKSAPSAAKLGICFPNALYDGIKANQAKGKGDTMVENMETGEQTVVDEDQEEDR